MPFKKGISGNPGGKPKGTKHVMTASMLETLLKAIKDAKGNKEVSRDGRDIFEHFLYRAYRSDVVLNAFMKKLIPDKTFNIEDIRGGNILVTFEIVDAKPKNRKEKQKEFGEEHNGTKKEKESKNAPNNNENDDSEIEKDTL